MIEILPIISGGIGIARRNKLEIVACILNACKSAGVSKTSIVHRAILNSKSAAIYLEWLTQHRYLAADGRAYKTTPAGLCLLSSIASINSVTNADIACESR
jgi:predicted transcriptional regulator